ncbi:MAG: rhodanese-like domain-containing protein [Desulfosalsimonadaceae bacterium]
MKTLYQIFAILLIAAVAGFGSNALRSEQLPLYSREGMQSRADAAELPPFRISLERAIELYKQEKAVFVDARPKAAYNSGHIKGAISLPWQKAEEQFPKLLESVPMEKPVVTYCDGEACELSDMLAGFLEELGYKKAWSLHNGWSRWREKGMPAEHGS